MKGHLSFHSSSLVIMVPRKLPIHKARLRDKPPFLLGRPSLGRSSRTITTVSLMNNYPCRYFPLCKEKGNDHHSRSPRQRTDCTLGPVLQTQWPLIPSFHTKMLGIGHPHPHLDPRTWQPWAGMLGAHCFLHLLAILWLISGKSRRGAGET